MKRSHLPRLVALLLVVGLAGCHRHKHADLDISDTAEPDKILYEKSVEDIQNKRYDVARLTLQTLLNTYPDSDYLAQAKLAIADSYFQEGTSGALTHAEVEYKDFITFFPHEPEVPFAQYRAAMCNFRRLEKPDRDRTYAIRAEREFQILLLDFPDSEYASDGEKKLIQVQEVLAEGEFRIARFYYVRQTWRAAASRLLALVERYPNYSRRDQALWMLGQSFERQIPRFWEPDLERAAESYARIVREHPMSTYVQDAKAALNRLGHPVPEPDPVLLARAQNVEPVATVEDKPNLLGRLFGMFSGQPDTETAAARLGPPPLEPPQEEPSLPPPLLLARADAAQDAESPEGGNGSEADAAQTQTPEKKKSFWRKLVPFI
jgi:outer membrane protein assembly factor BamD